MQRHILHLQDKPFLKIKNGTKKIEMRLFDEKRKLMNIGDEILFLGSDDETLLVKIVDLKVFKNFEELYNFYDKAMLGYQKDEVANPDDMLIYYPKEKQEKYGALAIEIEKE